MGTIQQPTWSGRAYKGAMRDRRATKRREAEDRNRAASSVRACGHKHGTEQADRCNPVQS